MLTKKGDNISVHYTGTFPDGTVFDSSVGGQPLQFELGSGMVIPGFDSGLTGMAIGEKKRIEIPAAEAYGEASPENMITIPRTDIPADMHIEIGTVLNMHQDGTGQVMQVTVVDLTTDSVTLDGNHPMAGKDLIFDVEIMAIG